jgi:hypothetical protein
VVAISLLWSLSRGKGGVAGGGVYGVPRIAGLRSLRLFPSFFEAHFLFVFAFFYPVCSLCV